MIRDDLQDIFLSDKVCTRQDCTYMDMFIFEEKTMEGCTGNSPYWEPLGGSLELWKRKGTNFIVFL